MFKYCVPRSERPFRGCRLIYTICNGKIRKIKKYLKEQVPVPCCVDHFGLTPLHVAVVMNCFEALEILLQSRYIDPFKVSMDFETSLFMALNRMSDKRIVERLMLAGFDPNFRTYKYKTYLHACKHKKFTRYAQIFIKCGADVDAADNDGLTPLHEAVRAQNLEYVQMLLYYRADATVKCFKTGSTAFMKALEAKSVEIAYELLDYEVDFDNINFYGKSTFALAMSCSHDLAEAILDRGLNINPKDFTLMVDTLMLGNKSIFMRVWPEINKRVLLHRKDKFLIEYLIKCPYNDEDWIECLYEILDSEVACEFVVDNFLNNTYSLLEAFKKRNIEKKERVKIIYLFLSLGMPVELKGALRFYNEFGHDEEFEAFLYMDVKATVRPMWDYSCLPGLFALYFGADIEQNLEYLIRRDCSDCYYDIKLYLEGILKVVNFCTFKKHLRDEFLLRRVLTNYHDTLDRIFELYELGYKILDNFDNMNMVPPLLELCRNSVRCFIFRNAYARKPCYYNTLLNSLKLPDSLKDIIKFKKGIYNNTTDDVLLSPIK